MAATVRTKISLLTIVLTAIMSCCSGPASSSYSSFSSIADKGWAYSDTLPFIANISDTVMTGPLVLSVCHDDDYIYANLWLELTYRTSDSVRTIRRDTINVPLANRYGRWYGSGFGTTFQASDTIVPTLRIERGDTLLVRHIMRVDTVHHISQIGLSLHTAKR